MTSEKSRTSITSVDPGKILIKGYDITRLMGKRTFAEVVYLILKGELPSEAEGRMMDAILTSSIDHGAGPLSSLAARTAVAGGNPLNVAVASGILAIGESHGGGVEKCARLLQEWASRDGDIPLIAQDLRRELHDKKMLMPGFGHRLHKPDPRTIRLFELAEKLDFVGRHQALARAIEISYRQDGKELPINIDGAIAAVISDMGFDWRLAKGVFIISRAVGIVAHAHEEQMREKPMRNPGRAEYDYDGPPPRKIS